MSSCDTCSANDGTCSLDSSTCGENNTDFKKNLNKSSNVKKVIGVVSGKGGVGKSLVTSLLSIYTNKKGYNTAILDADITGPSIPKVFGLNNKQLYGTDEGILPVESSEKIKIMSLNLLLKEDTDPVIWRGPVIANTVTQFWTDIVWGDIDYMFIDMPPGTGDVPLTVFQSLPVDGVIIVTSPQDLVSMIVSKSIKMAEMMDIPVLGIVENMSYGQCPDCGTKINIFGESKVDKIAKEYNIPYYDRIPINPEIAELSDKGILESIKESYLENVLSNIIK